MLFTSLKPHITAFIADQSGVAFIEYGVVVALILAVSVTVLRDIGLRIQTVFSDLDAALS